MATTHWEEINAFLRTHSDLAEPIAIRRRKERMREEENEAAEDIEEIFDEHPDLLADVLEAHDIKARIGEEEEEPEPAEPGSQPYSDALAAAADAAPASVSSIALSNPAVTVARWLDSLHQRAERPGSVLPLVFVLLFLIFAMVPVNGSATRFELIWRGLTGGAALPPSATELALAAQYQDLAAEQQTQATVASATWGAMWGVAGTLGIP